MRRRYLLAIGVLAVISIASASAVLFPGFVSGGCPSVLGHPVTKSTLTPTSFGAVTGFSLPSPARSPNGMTVAPDGSVWFGEQAVPGVAHFYPSNGTLVEYAFPGSHSGTSNGVHTCADKTDIWGVALWNGRVWATDAANNRILGLDPTSDAFRVIPLAANDSFPYTLTPGPNDELWFTQVLSGQIGTVFANGTVAEHSVVHAELAQNVSSPIDLPGVPTQIVFANGNRGYYVDASPVVRGSAIYAFDPEHFNPEQIGGTDQALHNPDSISLGAGGVWLAQHSGSSVAFYDLKDGNWTVYPTSGVGYVGTTLPYFVKTNGSLVWFNEHYGNRMAVLNPHDGTLTEYSVSDPPAGNLSQIDDAQTFALGGDKAWFTELTANKIGFVDASYRPPFTVSVAGNPSISLHRGEETSLSLELRGNSSSPIAIQLSGPGSVTMRADRGEVGSLRGVQALNVTLDAGQGAVPGRYILLVTATDGIVSRSAFLELSIIP